MDIVEVDEETITCIIFTSVLVLYFIPYRILYVIRCVKSSRHGHDAGAIPHMYLSAINIWRTTSLQGKGRLVILGQFKSATQARPVILREIPNLIERILLSKKSIKKSEFDQIKPCNLHQYSIMFYMQQGMSLVEFMSILNPLKPIQTIKCLHLNDMLRGIRIEKSPLQCILSSRMCSLKTQPRVNVAMFKC